jgi:hypothetical protein
VHGVSIVAELVEVMEAGSAAFVRYPPQRTRFGHLNNWGQGMATADLIRGQEGKPLLVYAGGWALIVLSIPGLLFTGLMVMEAVQDPTGVTFGALGVSGLTAAQFLAISPVLLVLTVSPAVLGHGLLQNKSWARPLGTFLWFGVALVTGGAKALAGLGMDRFIWSLIWGLLCTGAAFWYFYGKKNVRAYYARSGG